MRLQLFQDVFRFGEAVFGQFGEYFLGVNEDFKSPIGKRFQFEGRNALLEFYENFLRQTDGMGLVISLRAVFDQDVHAQALFTLVAVG
jgi:hypothetical protein